MTSWWKCSATILRAESSTEPPGTWWIRPAWWTRSCNFTRRTPFRFQVQMKRTIILLWEFWKDKSVSQTAWRPATTINQYYCLFIRLDHYLKITSDKEDLESRGYISGRVDTQGKLGFLYGEFEWKAKIPAGKDYEYALSKTQMACYQISSIHMNTILTKKSAPLNRKRGLVRHLVGSSQMRRRCRMSRALAPSGQYTVCLHYFLLEIFQILYI